MVLCISNGLGKRKKKEKKKSKLMSAALGFPGWTLEMQ
jgi:hypothetical protein